MRSIILLATAIAILSLGATGAQAMSPHRHLSPAAIADMQPAAAMVQTTAAEQMPAALASAESAKPNVWDGRTWRREIGPSLRTAFVLAFAGVLIGLGAVGVKSLWVAEEAEYAALSQEFRGDLVPDNDRMLTCLGDYPA